MVDYETDFYCKLSRYRKEALLWNGRAEWVATGMRVPGGLRRGKVLRGRRPHPAYYHGRRVHPAYYRKMIVRRPSPWGKVVWEERFPSNLHTTVSQWSVAVYSTLDPVGTWTWGGLYKYQVPYVRPMWVKWARQWEDEAANAGKVVP